MGKTHCFGVGCMHFATRHPVPEQFHPEQYSKHIVSFLEQYENISDIHLNSFTVTAGDGRGTNIGDDFFITKENIIPWPVDFQISFNIYIPLRIQQELIRGFEPLEEAERFHVFIYYSGEFPVLFATPTDKEIRRPSSKIMILREYLKRNHPNDEHIYLQFLGPSPFHADFYLKKAEPDKNEFEVVTYPLVGYDDIEVNLPAIFFTNNGNMSEEVLSEVFHDISKEVGLFYRVIAFQSETFRREEEITERIDSVSEKLFHQRFVLWISHLKEVKENTVNALILDVEMLERRKFYQKRTQDLDHLEGLAFFKGYTNQEIENIKETRIPTTLRILKEMESYAQTAILGQQSLVAATIGAIIGGVLTWLIQS